MDDRLNQLELAVKEIQVDSKYTRGTLTELVATNNKILEAIELGNNNHRDILEIKEHAKRIDRDLLKLDPILTIMKYPKAALLAASGLYLFTIKDIRDPLFRMLGIL